MSDTALAKRGSRSLSQRKQDTVWKNLTAIEAAHGGRAQLRETLEFSQLTAPQSRFVDLLHDPARAGDSLRTLCRDAGMAPFELLEMLHQGVNALAMTEAQITMATALPDIVADVADKAKDHFVQCHCALTPDGPQPPDPGCLDCKGRGYRHVDGSFDHQKLIFDAAKLTPRAGGVNIRNENKTLVMPSGDAFDHFVKATDGRAAIAAPVSLDTVDAEILP